MSAVPCSWHPARFPDRFQIEQIPLTWESEQHTLRKGAQGGCPDEEVHTGRVVKLGVQQPGCNEVPLGSS